MALFSRKKVERVPDHIILDHIEHYQERWINLHTIKPQNDEMRKIFDYVRQLIGDKKLITGNPMVATRLPEGPFVWSTFDDKSWYWNGKLGETTDGQFIRGTLWDWSKRDFSRRDLTNIRFHGPFERRRWLDLRKSYFGDSEMYKAHFYQCDLRDVRFDRAYLKYAWFERCDLRGARFHNSLLERATFRSSDLRNTDFRGAAVFGADISFGCEGSGFGTTADGLLSDFRETPQMLTAKEKYQVEDVYEIPDTPYGTEVFIIKGLLEAVGLMPGVHMESLLPYPPFKYTSETKTIW